MTTKLSASRVVCLALVFLLLAGNNVLGATAIRLEKEVPRSAIPSPPKPVTAVIYSSATADLPAASQTLPLGALMISRAFTLAGEPLYRFRFDFTNTDALDIDMDLWWELKIGGTVVGERERVPSVGYSLFAEEAGTAAQADHALTASNADTLDGLNAVDFAASAHGHSGGDLTGWPGSLSNADLLDNLDSTAFAPATHTHAGSEIVGGSGSWLDADTLDGFDSTAFSREFHHHDDRYYRTYYISQIVTRISALEALGNLRPTADAGPDQIVTMGNTVLLDGSASFDPEGAPLTYSWTVVSRPSGSTVYYLTDRFTATPSFTADLPGDYALDLVVNDGSLSSMVDSIVVTVAGNVPPVADAGPDQSIAAGPAGLVQLDGSASSDYEGGPLTYSWSFHTMPAASTAVISDPTAANPTFTADVDGAYVLSLVVNDGIADSLLPDTVTVTAYIPVSMLDFLVIDAEYSRALDRIVMISATPTNELHIYDPVLKQDVPVALPQPPVAVSLTPDGLQAVVGHDGLVSLVDLGAASLVKTVPHSADVHDVVAGGNGFAYVFPGASSSPYNIHSIDLVSESEIIGPDSIYYRYTAKLHPLNSALYAVEDNSSSGRIRNYDVSAGGASYLRNVWHSYYDICSDLWISEDGFKIYTGCGHIFRASTDPAEDMAYLQSLPDTRSIRHVHDSASVDRAAVIYQSSSVTPPNDMEVQIFEGAPATFLERKSLPVIVSVGNSYPGHGRFVFFRSDGSELYVIVQAEAGSGLLYDFGIITY